MKKNSNQRAHRACLFAGALVLVFCLWPTGAARAADCAVQGEGCWKCEYYGIVSGETYCSSVSAGHWGTGTYCKDCDIAGWICIVTGPECVTVGSGGGGGGGGTGGGGGGGSCTVVAGQVCPASCMSCETFTF